MLVFFEPPVDCIWNGGSDLQAGVEIYHWGYPQFWLILSSQNDPLLGPQFQPPVWSIGGPIYLSMPMRSPDPILLFAPRYGS